VQNAAARLVVRYGRKKQITTVLKRLHRLLIYQRITYKLMMLTYRAIHELTPRYLGDLLDCYTTVRPLRPTAKTHLRKRVTRQGHRDRMLAAGAPRTWNRLPLDLKSTNCLPTFKRLLKTHLFNEAFNCQPSDTSLC